MTKGEKIRETRKKTYEKRKSQVCRIFTVKIDESHLSKDEKERLKMTFVEAKWFCNHVLAWSQESKDNNIFKFEKYKCKKVIVKNKDGEPEERELKHLKATIKLSLHEHLCRAIKTVSTKKKLGQQKNGGKLKFKKEVRSIEFKQYGNSHRIEGNRVRLQGFKRPFRVNGLEQLVNIEGIEYANFRLLSLPSGYYIQIITFTPKENIIKEDSHLEPIGIDFGCQNSFTFSNGKKVDVKIGESERLRRYMRKLSRRVKRSNNRDKARRVVAKEYQKEVNQKKDIANKLVGELKKHKLIVIQDEQIAKWAKSRHGKVIRNSILGRVKQMLKALPQTVVLNKLIPTTKLCTNCGKTHDISIKKRDFSCPHCGCYHEDRDIHAAENMLWIAQNLFKSYIPLGQRDFKRVEFLSELDKHFCFDNQETAKHEADNT